MPKLFQVEDRIEQARDNIHHHFANETDFFVDCSNHERLFRCCHGVEAQNQAAFLEYVEILEKIVVATV